ncbi:heavy metal-binding protein HIP-like isoform X2 [Denticeps clupeoides]|uniref:heavy metal-binding protein HIP-like isoform X2 n=1 Tax=Denticeps clupeoides TaxID=299321 RepID=UPI0010A4D0D7|nr:heavy metal-binding protein HIP-like isoform X2 [Denticeps clupeoides]
MSQEMSSLSVFSMKVSVALLVFLCSSLLVVEGKRDGREAETACASQENCLPEIFTLLREMSTTIAVQKVDLSHTNTNLRSLERQMEELKNTKEVLTEKLNTLETKMKLCEQTIEEQKTQIHEMSVTNTEMKSKVEDLTRQIEVKKVAFSASFAVSANKHIGPLTAPTSLIYDHVFTNIGDAYNPKTGQFTAPVRGVYFFQLHIFAGGSNPAGANLLKNGQHMIAAYNHKAPHDINTSNGVSLLLEVGDVVSVTLGQGSWIAAYTSHLSTFGGYLLFPM